VAALLNNLAALKYVDAVGVLNGTESMSHGDGGAAGCGDAKGLLDGRFRVRVERGGGLVEESGV
jgi:hypothetical protein